MCASTARSVAAVFFLFATSIRCQQPSENYPHSAVLQSPDVFNLFWKFDSTSVTFEIHAKTTGWVGFGLSPTGRMQGGDMVIGWIKDGNTCFKDRYAKTDKEEPVVDGSQDWLLLSAREVAPYTILKVRRQLDTCDVEDVPITDDTIHVIYAYSPTDPSDCDTEIGYHGNHRGSVGLYILNNVKTVPQLPDDVTTITVQSSVTVPGDPFSRRCMVLKLHDLATKHHAVKIEPSVDNEDLLGNIIIYACPATISSRLLNREFDCTSPPAGFDMISCDIPLFTWAVGTGAFIYPQDVGFPVGGQNEPRFVVLEKHFKNKNGRSGVTDTSGLRLAITPTLRQHDASLLKIGHAYTNNKKITQVIPPTVETFVNYGHCVHQCLSEAMTQPAMNIFSTTFYARSLAKAMRLRHIRQGVEQPIISKDNHYDYSYQATRQITEPIRVFPVDDLMLECTYDTSQKTERFTLSGMSGPNEECLAYVQYYPRIANLTNCLSAPTIEGVMRSVGVTRLREVSRTPFYVVDEPAEHAGKTWLEVLSSMSWQDQTNVAKLQDGVKTSKVKVHCYKGVYTEFDIDSSTISVPSITRPLPPDATTCIEKTTVESSTRSSATKHGPRWFWPTMIISMKLMCNLL